MSNTNLLGAYGGLGNSGLQFRNRIINGDMKISQRYGSGDATYTATNIASGAQPTYLTDRFSFRIFGSDYTAGDVAIAAQSTDAPAGFVNSLKITAKQNVSFSGNRLGAFISQPIEGLNVVDFGLGTASAIAVTLSFWVKSNKTGTVSVSFENAAADRSYGTFVTISQAATWEKKTVTVQLDNTGTWLKNNGTGLSLIFGVGNNGSWLTGAAGSWSATRAIFNAAQTNFLSTTNDYLAITGVQLEAGPVATPFEHRPIGMELQLCQRYFEIVIGASQGISLFPLSTDFIRNAFPFKVTKRSSSVQMAGGTSGAEGGNNSWAFTLSATENFWAITAYTGAVAVRPGLNGPVTASAEL